MTAYCAVPSCSTIIIVTPGAKAVRTCSAHTGQRPADETDQQRIARVCEAMGWRRGR